MSEYAQRFANNDIDFSILCDLTDQDLPASGIPESTDLATHGCRLHCES